jgi:hypothetical protein
VRGLLGYAVFQHNRRFLGSFSLPCFWVSGFGGFSYLSFGYLDRFSILTISSCIGSISVIQLKHLLYLEFIGHVSLHVCTLRY